MGGRSIRVFTLPVAEHLPCVRHVVDEGDICAV
jgi:hypothetical protein